MNRCAHSCPKFWRQQKMAPLPGKLHNSVWVCAHNWQRDKTNTFHTFPCLTRHNFPHFISTAHLAPTPLATPLTGSVVSLQGFKGQSRFIKLFHKFYLYYTRARVHPPPRKPKTGCVNLPTLNPPLFSGCLSSYRTHRSVICLPPPPVLRSTGLATLVLARLISVTRSVWRKD